MITLEVPIAFLDLKIWLAKFHSIIYPFQKI